MTLFGFVGLVVVGLAFAFIAYNVGWDRGKAGRKKFPWLAVVLIVLSGMTMLLSGDAGAQTRTVSWTAVTTYASDGSTIEAANLPIRYDIKAIDNVTGVETMIVSNTTSLFVTFDDSTWIKGRRYNFTARARTQDGAESAWSQPPYGWTRPFQTPTPVTGLTIN